jgi:hypothetical protein
MATNEMENRCGSSLEAASGLKGQKKMRLSTAESRAQVFGKAAKAGVFYPKSEELQRSPAPRRGRTE